MQAILFRHQLEIRARYWWYRLKVLLGQNVNVDKNFFPSDAAMRLSQGILPKGTRITCAGRSDGVGMQALARMSGINFAKAFGATYVDTPFKYIDHAPGDMGAWIEAWEALFHFDKGHDQVDNGKYNIIDYSDYLLNKHEINDNTVLRFQQCYWLNRLYPDTFSAVTGDFQHKYGFPTQRDDERHIFVAVHIRRGDVGTHVNALRFTPNEKILTTIRCLKEIEQLLGVTFSIEIFSQGEASEFAEFSELGCRLHLDADAVWTMRKLIEADLLVMSKSSFSYVAALINRGVKIYEPTFNPPLSAWVVKRGDGSFDKEIVKVRLAASLDDKVQLAFAQ